MEDNTYVCQGCGQEFTIHPCSFKPKYCSPGCKDGAESQGGFPDQERQFPKEED